MVAASRSDTSDRGDPSPPKGASPEPVQRLSLDALRSAVISPIVSPLPTAVALIGDALSDRDRAGSLPQVRRALLAQLRGRDITALLPLRAGERLNGADGRPNEVVPAGAGASIDEELQAVVDVDPDQLSRSIDAASRAGHPAGPWRPVARDSARWLRSYAEALRRAWVVLEPFWRRSADLLDRDVERVSVALAHGAGAELIAQLYPYCSVVDDELLLPSHSNEPGRVRVGDLLLLYPLLAPVSASGWTDDYADQCLAVRYSLPNAWRVFEGEHPPPASLEALVGPQRAKILHRLDRPATAGELAEMLFAVPSMASHHLRALEAAGLITRSRDGRKVWVRRSARGTELVALYERG